MSNAASTENCNVSCACRHKIEASQYGETMFFIDTPATITAKEQRIFNELLENNQGIGIIAGHFDENMTVCMISKLAARILGCHESNEFPNDYALNLYSLLVTDDEKEFFRNKLLSPDGKIWGYSLITQNDSLVSVRISNMLSTDENGEKMWYMSIRRFAEFEYDILTGSYNRIGFIRQVKELQKHGDDLTNYAILSTNIRDFKAINDIYGSEVGDDLLKSIYNHFCASRLNPVFCARNESDKFLMLVKKENLDLDNLPDILKMPCILGGKPHIVENVCGVYCINDNNKTLEIMIDCAKIARQYIKDAFVCPYSVFNPTMRSDYLGYANALLHFEEAFSNNEFKVYYQPILDCKTEKIVSAEALVRWESAEYGILSPATFVPALEESGGIVKLDRYVYYHLFDILHKRLQEGLPVIPVSINLSRMDFFDNEKIAELYHCLKTDEAARKYIRFEITETSHHMVSEAQKNFMKMVNSYGGVVCLDDFGTANSSLDMLSQYDFSVLKLDMQFIRKMIESSRTRSLVKSMINMAHALNMNVVAEGVETKEQLDILRSFDCDCIQGYYFSKPLPTEEFVEFMMAHL